VNGGELHGLALCAGFGGLELALDLVFGASYRTVCFVERDIVQAGILAARMEDGSFDPAPIWDDLTTFDGERWRGRVDIVTAGFPCQPFSVAGKRLGQSDERWIWPDIARIIREIRPRFVFLENVPGLIRHGLRSVAGDLVESGFAAEWDCFTAAEVGAPHKRERVFILAYRDWEREPQRKGDVAEVGRRTGDGGDRLADASGVESFAGYEHDEVGRRPNDAEQIGMGGRGLADAGRASSTAEQYVAGSGGVASDACAIGGVMANADVTHAQRNGRTVRGGEKLAASDNGSRAMGDTTRGRLGTDGRASRDAGHADQSDGPLADTGNGFVPVAGRESEGRTGIGSTGANVADANGGRCESSDQGQRNFPIVDKDGGCDRSDRAAFPPGRNDREGWAAYVGAGGPEPAIRRGADGSAGRNDRLFSAGNGVVPLAAAYAFITLADRLGLTMEDE
jgi:DNA (cytosine-5)-methyltransferase 1